MGNENVKRSAMFGAIWKFAERIAAQMVTFVVSVVLARILLPEQYGIISIVMVFIAIANVFVTDGFSAALIQKKNANSLDYTSVLYGGGVLAIILYIILFLCAPAIAAFYEEPLLTPVLRVLALRIPLASVNSVQVAYLSKRFQFKKFFLATIVGTLISGIVGISMAYAGYGVWALVGQNLTNYTIDILILSITIRKIPKTGFSFERVKSLFSFGGKVLFTNLFFTLVNQMRSLIIGKKYSTADLSFYTKGLYFPNLIGQNISGPLSSALFPALSKIQNDITAIKDFLRKSVHLITFCVTPLLLGLAAVAEPMVNVLLTEKWLPCVAFIRYGAIYHSFTVMHSTNLEAVKGIGAGDQMVKYGLIKRVVSIVVLLLTVWVSVDAIAIGLIISAIISTFINAYQNKKLFGYDYKEQIADFLPNMLMAATMACLTYLLGGLLNLAPLFEMVIQVCFGVIVYCALSILTRNRSLTMLLSQLKRRKI